MSTVAGAEPLPRTGLHPSNLVLRVLSALVMAPLALAAAYVGGWLFILFWAAAAIAVLWEWIALVAGAGHRLIFSAAASAIGVAAALVGRGRPIAAMLVFCLGALAAVIFATRDRRVWIGAGVFYAAAMLLAPVLLRGDESLGLQALLLLFVVVWSTDIFAYFAGRAIGGPKLLPAISPKKTWAGAIAGTAGAMLLATAGAAYLGSFDLAAIAALALLLSVVSQIGDLLESSIKRRFGAKDASHLIPGHGGVMDRLDGFWAAAVIACLIGVARGGLDHAANGLLIW